jgi:hypothetical protein
MFVVMVKVGDDRERESIGEFGCVKDINKIISCFREKKEKMFNSCCDSIFLNFTASTSSNQ